MANELSARDYGEMIDAVARGAEDAAPDHRRAPRVEHRGRIQIIPYGADGPGAPMLVSIRNFSPRGICIVSPSSMLRGRVFVARLPRGETTINLLYTVVHCTFQASRQHVIGAELSCVLRPTDKVVNRDDAQVESLRHSILD